MLFVLRMITSCVYPLSLEDAAFGSRDPLRLELDINVSEDEMLSIDDDLHPTLYPGMSCPVHSCHETS